MLRQVDIDTLLNKIKNIMKLDEEGRPFFLVSENDLTNQELLGLHLIARHFAKIIDIPSIKNEYLSIKELAQFIGTKYSIAKTRLREMYKQKIVEKKRDGETSYKITNTGINVIADRIISKMNSG